SSASNRLSWQPSQEANLNIAMRGLLFDFFLELIFVQQRPDFLVREHRTVFADEVSPVLAVPAEALATLHIAFHGYVNVIAIEAQRLQFTGDEPHHDLRAADHRNGARGMQPCITEQGGHDTHVPVPAQTSVVHGRKHLGLALPGPCRQFLAIDHIARAAGAVQDHQPPVLLAIAQNFVDDRPQGRQPDPSGDNDDVAAARGFHWPAHAKRPAHANLIAGAAAYQRMGRFAHRAHRVYQLVGLAGIAADRDGQLSHAEYPKHAELSRTERNGLHTSFRMERERERVRRVLIDALHHVRLGQPGILSRRNSVYR